MTPIERAAEAIWDRGDHDNMWSDAAHDALCPDLRNGYRDSAHAALLAAIDTDELARVIGAHLYEDRDTIQTAARAVKEHLLREEA